VIVTWAAEHQSVLGAVRRQQSEGHAVHVLGVDQHARAEAEDIPASATLVSIGLANNEVGTIYPTQDIASLARAEGISLLVDATQAAGHLAIDSEAWGHHISAYGCP